MSLKFDKFRWASHNWTHADTAPGEMLHAVFFGLWAYFGFLSIGGVGLILAIGGALLWEIKDAFLPWEENGWWGGDGFSLVDVAADLAGIMFFLVVPAWIIFVLPIATVAVAYIYLLSKRGARL
ncbi:MAG: hypothetical protein M1469_01310 [Bacteroidetes bacterium]|nr:hypothetical protein [Bacteroidota bacterium]MCL5266727.1 hypothetical protein [Bacteroidota bacterium]